MGLAGFPLTLATQAATFATSTEGHHLQPGGWVDYTISVVGAIIVAYVIYFTIDRFVRPRETERDHIKRKVLEEPR